MVTGLQPSSVLNSLVTPRAGARPRAGALPEHLLCAPPWAGSEGQGTSAGPPGSPQPRAGPLTSAGARERCWGLPGCVRGQPESWRGLGSARMWGHRDRSREARTGGCPWSLRGGQERWAGQLVSRAAQENLSVKGCEVASHTALPGHGEDRARGQWGGWAVARPENLGPGDREGAGAGDPLPRARRGRGWALPRGWLRGGHRGRSGPSKADTAGHLPTVRWGQGRGQGGAADPPKRPWSGLEGGGKGRMWV